MDLLKFIPPVHYPFLQALQTEGLDVEETDEGPLELIEKMQMNKLK